jgi:hypothetical protein
METMNYNHPDLNEFVWFVANSVADVVNQRAKESLLSDFTTALEILGPSKHRVVSFARKLLFLACRTWIGQDSATKVDKLTISLCGHELESGRLNASWTTLGLIFGRDHTTVLLGARSANTELLSDVRRILITTYGYGNEDVVIKIND